MILQPGARLGTFEILAELGRGGMGVVWSARDTTLRREVAIKVLPDAVASDPERISRFEREARSLASLNHPNVAHLYGFFTEPSGSSAAAEAPLPFLVMELVSGETLADRIARGRLPVDETIAIFLEIARGLEAAHAKGIVHRDLKPANIKITGDDARSSRGPASGTVKILDFGLAKALAQESEPAGAAAFTESPTLTQAATLRGEILGTAAYMSPEQARGRPVDERADVWAFGVCLYEALTGARLFEGEDAASSLAKVLESSPRFEALPADTPVALRRLLRRCLRKHPAERLHHIADARLELEDALAGAAPEEVVAATGVTPKMGRTRRMAALAAAVALVGGVAIGLVATRLFAPKESAAPERFLVDVEGTTDTGGPNHASAVALAPRDPALVLAITRDGASQLWRRRFDRLELEPIVGTEGGFSPSFSRDGKWLAFATMSAVMKVPAAGGLPMRVDVVKQQNWGLDWSDDGALVLTDDSEGPPRLWILPAGGGAARRVTSPTSTPRKHAEIWPAALPGGRAVVFADWEKDEESMRLVAVETDGGEVHPLLPGSQPKYSPTGHLLFTRPGSLWAVPFDPRALAPLGPAVRVAEDVATDPLTGRADYALGADGTLVYRRTEASRLTKLVWIDDGGNQTATSAPAGDYQQIALSPDGRRVALSRVGDLWVFDLASGASTRLPFEDSFDISPTWSTDGRMLAFASIATDTPGLHSVRADGSASPEKLAEAPDLFVPKVWVDRPRGILGEVGIKTSDIVFIHLESDRGAEALVETSARETLPAVSPDERWLAYESDESGQSEVYVRPFSDVASGRRQVSNEGGSQPMWGAGSDRLYYRRGDELVAVTIVAGGGDFVTSEPSTLFSLRGVLRGSSQHNFNTMALAPDGRFLALVDATADGGSTKSSLVLVKNFASELPHLVPRD